MKKKYKYHLILQLIVLATVSILLGFMAGVVYTSFTTEKTEIRSYESSTYIQGNTIRAYINPIIYESRVMGSLIGQTEIDILAEKIIECESGGNPNACNEEYGKTEKGYCKAGSGLFQLIPSTIKYCKEKLNKEIDPFNPEDNRECGMWLLKNEGLRHWGDENTEWGSWACWSK